MPKPRPRSLAWLLLLALVLGIGSGVGAVAAQDATPAADDAADDARLFRRYLDDTSSLPIVFGPEEGELPHEEETLSVEVAEVDLRDFILHAEFVNPYAASTADWDMGVLFWLDEEEPHLRLIVTSRGDWFLAPDSEEPIDSGSVEGLNLGPDQRNAIDLVVDGDTGYFGVNGDYVATLDLAAVDGRGDVAVATSFSTNAFQEGAVTGYEDFLVWEWTAEEEATAAAEPDAGTPVPDDGTPIAGNGATPVAGDEATPVADDAGDDAADADAERYESREFGYALRYDETWAVEDGSVQEGFDYLRLGNGLSTVDVTGLATDLSPAECLEDEFRYYQETDGYSDAQVALDVDDNEMRGELEEGAWGVFWFTFTAEDGDPTDYTAYVECRSLAEGEALLKIVHFVPSEDYNDEIAARVALLEGLQLDAPDPDEQVAERDDEARPSPEPDEDETAEPEEGETPQPEDDETPAGEETAEADDEPTPEAAGDDALVVVIEPTDADGPTAFASLEPAGTRTRVRVLALAVEDGTALAIQEGSCDDLQPEAAFELDPVESTVSATTIRIALDELVDGDYAITLHEDADDLSAPLACGEIVPLEE